MGTHLSRDEILFTSLRWEELYEEAQQRYLTAPHGANQNDKESNPFLLSHIEWQALLGSLQEGKMKNRKEAIPFSSGPTTLCSMKIDKSTLHEPLVVLTVHAIAWIRGVFHTQQEGNHLNENSDEIDKNADTIFFDKVEALLDVLNDVSWHTPVASDEEGGDNGGEESSSSEDGEMEEQEEEEPITSREVHQPANEDNHNDHETKSKRQRLWAAAVGVKNKVQRRGNNNNKDMDRQTSKNEFTTRSSNSCPRSNLFTCFQRLYDILLISRNREGSSSDNSGGVRNDERREFKEWLYLIQKQISPSASGEDESSSHHGNTNRSIRQRPVLMLCAHLLLLIAACQFPEPTFSEFANTKILVELVATIKSWKQKRSANDIADDDENGDAHEEEKLWPLLSFLHHRLLRRQQQLEVLEEVEKTKQNQSCQRELSHYYYNRIEHADQQEEPNSEGWWTAQRQQYIGQPFAWRAVQEVFLHGGLLERRKANVLLFFGPSGYGKSELARRIAVALHGTEEVEAEGKLLMIHMPSYCTRDSIYSLVDPPAAHVGDGMLLSALLKQKDAVIILDEFEKSTADSIQNLWLSAFQKNGTIRSLKQKDRCVSTVETTFILTCNLCDDMIQQDRHAFLRATPSEQQQYTQRYIRQCKEKCTTLFGEPFVNRVDYFLPFVPYSEAERRQFVLLQLERILGYQTTKQRTLFVTHRFVDQLVKIVTTFHANKVEEVLKPLLIYMSSKKWHKAVLTATVMYVQDQEEAAAADGGDAPRVGFYDVHGQNTKVRFSLLPTVRGEAATEAHQGSLTYWEDFPSGKECVERWEKEVEELKQGKDKTPPPTAAAAPVERPKEVEDVIVNAPASATGAVFQGNREEKEMELITEKEVQLHKELVATKELLVQKDKEIALLKEKVLLLEKLVALLVCALLSCVLVLSFVVGLKLALLWLAFLFFVGTVVFHIPLSVLIGALSSFFRFLGPVKGCVLAVCLISWVWAGVKQRVYCA